MDVTSLSRLPARGHDIAKLFAGTNAKSATSIDKQEFDSTPTPFHKLMQRRFPVILRLAVSQVCQLPDSAQQMVTLIQVAC